MDLDSDKDRDIEEPSALQAPLSEILQGDAESTEHAENSGGVRVQLVCVVIVFLSATSWIRYRVT